MVGFYLLFDRNCAEAIETYQKALNAELVTLRKYSDLPPDPAFPVAESDRNLVLHAQLRLENTELLCADSLERNARGDNMYVSVTTRDAALVQKAWDILRQGGKVYHDVAPSFFASLHGSLQDRYGVNWMFSALKDHSIA